MAKKDYDSINFKNKDIDKFATAFSEKKDPIKMPSITATAESTNVKLPTEGINTFTARDPAWVNYKKGPGQLRADKVYKAKQEFNARVKANKQKP
jgi:hypothetical protein